MATFGPYNLTTFISNAVAGALSWTTPENAAASDDAYARAVNLAAGAETQYLDCRTLASPAVTGTVIGIKVEVEERAAAANVVSPVEIKLIVGGAITGTSRHEGAVPVLAAADTYYRYGAIVDLWGLSLTAAQVNAANFGVAIRYKNNDASARTVFVDHVRVTIYTADTPAEYSTGFTAGTLAADWRQMSQTLGSASDATGACVFTAGEDEFTAAQYAKPEDTTRVFDATGALTGVRVTAKIVDLAAATEAIGILILGSPKRHMPQVYATFHRIGSGARIKTWDGVGPDPVTYGGFHTSSAVAIEAGMWVMCECVNGRVAVYASATSADGPWTCFGTANVGAAGTIRGLAGVSGRHDSNSTVDDFSAEPITMLSIEGPYTPDAIQIRAGTPAMQQG